jgi:hypothetical protein
MFWKRGTGNGHLPAYKNKANLPIFIFIFLQDKEQSEPQLLGERLPTLPRPPISKLVSGLRRHATLQVFRLRFSERCDKIFIESFPSNADSLNETS